MEKEMPLQVVLEYGKFFDYGEQYHVSFVYANEEQKQKMYDYISSLLPLYGMNGSMTNNDSRNALMPYFVNEKGEQVFPGNVIGGTRIPKELLGEFLRKFIEADHAIVKAGNVTINGKIDDDLINAIIDSLGPKKTAGLNR